MHSFAFYFTLIIYLLSKRTEVTGTLQQKFYQDLTGPIDKILNEAHMDSLQTLRKALKESTYVFYSSDILLNNITQIIPILNLLNKAKPRSSRYHLMLSLRYTHQNRFRWERLDDVFYDLSLNITLDTQTLLKRHLTAIVLDWQVETCQTPEYFFSKTSIQPVHGFGYSDTVTVVTESSIKSLPYSFPKYVKNFVQMYCGDSKECSAIQVGVSYSFVQMGCGGYLLNQIRDADFIVVSLPFSFRNFPFYYDMFTSYLVSMEVMHEAFTGANWNKGKFFHVSIDDPLPPSIIVEQWKKEFPELESVLSSSKYFSDVVQQLLLSAHEKSFKLLQKYLEQYTSMDNMTFASKGVILGEKLVYDKLSVSMETTLDSASKLFVPHFYTDELNASPCRVKQGLESSQSGVLLVNAETWRAAARFKNKIMDSTLNCSGPDYNNNHMETYNKTTSVILFFGGDIISIWNDMEKYVSRLIRNYPQVGNANLKTLAFSEDHLTNSIPSFISQFSKEFTMACLFRFDQRLLEGFKVTMEMLKLQSVFTNKYKFSNIMNGICSPALFPKFHVLIWNIDSVDFSRGRDIIVVAREVFMKEFPGKSVLFQFTANLDPEHSVEYIFSWAEFYGVPVSL